MPHIDFHFNNPTVHQICIKQSCYYRPILKSENQKEYAQKVFVNTIVPLNLSFNRDDPDVKLHLLSIALNETIVALIYDPENIEYAKQLKRLYKSMEKIKKDRKGN